MSDETDIYDMDLHAEIEPWRGLRIVRVAGGWIYYCDTESGAGGWQAACVFIPFHNEFQKAKP